MKPLPRFKAGDKAILVIPNSYACPKDILDKINRKQFTILSVGRFDKKENVWYYGTRIPSVNAVENIDIPDNWLVPLKEWNEKLASNMDVWYNISE